MATILIADDEPTLRQALYKAKHAGKDAIACAWKS